MATNLDLFLAEKICTRMDEKGLSRLSLAERSGIPYTTLKRKLVRAGTFTGEEMSLLARALETEVSELFEGWALADSTTEAQP